MVTLNKDKAPPTSFEVYRDELIHDAAKTLTALGFCLIPLFFVLDLFTMPPALLDRFGVYRILGTFWALAQYGLLRKKGAGPRSYLHGYAFSLMVGGMIVQMTVDLGGFSSAYYAGLILVVVAVDLLLPWRPIHSALNGAMVVVLYVVANSVWGGTFTAAALINNLYFLCSTVVIAVAINFVKYRLIEREFRLRSELLQVNQTLDRSREDLRAARDALWEMAMAKHIQTALLPPKRRLTDYEVAAKMIPADEVGGDYFDIIETRTGEQWAAVGDVSGHGVESGLVMMMAQTSLLTMVQDAVGRRPSEVFQAVNGVLRENISRLGTHRYMTLNVIRLHPDRLTVAGKHQDILIHRARTNQVEVVANDGSWVGLIDDTRRWVHDLDVPLEEGDTVLLFTDGVTESTNQAGEMYGQDRLTSALARVAPLPVETALSELCAELDRFHANRQDDLTLLLLRRAGTPPRARA